jgi:hypothetical protein
MSFSDLDRPLNAQLVKKVHFVRTQQDLLRSPRSSVLRKKGGILLPDLQALRPNGKGLLNSGVSERRGSSVAQMSNILSNPLLQPMRGNL